MTLPLRTQLTLIYMVVFARDPDALSLASYATLRATARRGRDDRPRSEGRAVSRIPSLCRRRGALYLRSRPTPTRRLSLHEATRYYQVYDAHERSAAGAVTTAWSPSAFTTPQTKSRSFATAPDRRDIQTDHGRLRVTSTVITPASGGVYLVQVGMPLEARWPLRGFDRAC